MEWTPLIVAADFDGIKTDVMTCVAGLLSLAMIVVAVGVIYRIFSR